MNRETYLDRIVGEVGERNMEWVGFAWLERGRPSRILDWFCLSARGTRDGKRSGVDNGDIHRGQEVGGHRLDLVPHAL